MKAKPAARRTSRFPLVRAISFGFVLAPAVHAASDTWKTTAGTGNWNTGSNWVGGANPGNGTTTGSNTDIATFNATSNFSSVNLSTDRNLLGLTFDGAGAYTITSTSNAAGRYFFTRGGTTQMTSTASVSQNLSGMFMRIGQGISGGNSNYTFLNNATSSSNVFTLGAIRNASNVTSTLLLAGSNTGLNKITGVIDETSGGANVLAVNKSGLGTWILDTANSYTGGTTIDAGILGIGSSTALGSGGLTINGGTLASVTSPRTITNNVTVGGDFKFGGFNQSLTMNGTMDLGGATRTITLENSVTIGGVISNGGLTVAGGIRTMTLNTASNTYTGTTLVSSGILRINGNNSSATGAVTVSSGATLGGSGTVGGATGISGTHSTGSATATVGTQTFSSTLNYASGSIFEWDLNATNSPTDPGLENLGGATYDKVVAVGAITGSGVVDKAVFKIVLGTNSFTDVFWDTNKSWTDIFTGGSGSATNLAALFSGFDSSGGVDAAGIVTGQGQFTLSNTGNTLSWTAVPEPTSALAGLLVASGLLRRRRN